jgi:hypothetical protein
MQSIYGFILYVVMTILMTTYGKKYNAVEKNRLRITKLYRNHILTRPSLKNVSQITTVAIGLGIIEVAGIDPQKQVGISEIFLLIIRSFNR